MSILKRKSAAAVGLWSSLVLSSDAGAILHAANGGREDQVTSEVAQDLLESVGASRQTYETLNAVVSDLIQSKDRRVVPVLVENFHAAETFYDSFSNAALLVYVGAEDPKYWKFVHDAAKEAIESGIPDSIDPGIAPGTSHSAERAEFARWRHDRGLTLEEALAQEKQYSMAVFMLGATVDPRASDILLQALESRNSGILLAAIKALARLQDERAVDPIIGALERMPSNLAKAAALPLVYFDNPRAQAAAERFIDDEQLLESMRTHVASQGLEGIYGH